MTVRALVNAVRRGGGEIALSKDGRSLIGRNIPKALHHHLKNTANRDLVLHAFRVTAMLKDPGPGGGDKWAAEAEAAIEADLVGGRYVTSPWTGGLITTDEYLETYATGDRRPS